MYNILHINTDSIRWHSQSLLVVSSATSSVAFHGLLHLCGPPPLEGEKNKADDYITVAELGHCVLEPLAKRILALLELLDLLL